MHIFVHDHRITFFGVFCNKYSNRKLMVVRYVCKPFG